MMKVGLAYGHHFLILLLPSSRNVSFLYMGSPFVKNASSARPVAEPASDRKVVATQPVRIWKHSFWQVVRFGIVGVCNTAIDVLVLNLFLWRFPTQNIHLLLLYNSLAFISGAFNSYILNKYWTFRHTRRPTGSELLRFATVNGASFLCNNGI